MTNFGFKSEIHRYHNVYYYYFKYALYCKYNTNVMQLMLAFIVNIMTLIQFSYKYMKLLAAYNTVFKIVLYIYCVYLCDCGNISDSQFKFHCTDDVS